MLTPFPGAQMFGTVVQLRTMLDNFGPIARTAPAPYVIVDCEQRSFPPCYPSLPMPAPLQSAAT